MAVRDTGSLTDLLKYTLLLCYGLYYRIVILQSVLINLNVMRRHLNYEVLPKLIRDVTLGASVCL